MRMSEEHRKELIEEMSKIDTTSFYGFPSWTSPDYRDMGFDNTGVFLRDVKFYKFDNMIPRIILMINDEGIYKIPSDVSNSIREFLERDQEIKFKLTSDDYKKEKRKIEILCSKTEGIKNSPLGHLRALYSRIIYDEIIYENMENMIVAECPNLVSKEPISKINYPIPIDVVDVPVFYLGGFRKWIWYDGDKINHYGGFRQDELQKIESEIKSIIRKNKIEKIGI